MRLARTVVLVALIPVAAGAQAIRGTAVDRGGSPVSGAVVLMVDERDSVTARALTNESGEFRVVAARPGAYRLRTMRIGFRPAMSPAMTLASGQELAHQLTLSGVPAALDTVRVVGRNSCRTTGDSASATFAIWEQVRTALSATQLTTGMRGIDATLITYQRALDPDRERILSQQSWVVSGLTRGLWSSLSPDSLRRVGYVTTNPLDGATTYWGPDMRVLLSDQFIEDHCFRLAEAKDHRQIGIAFEPTRERRNVPGIRGTLWLDRKSSELRRMEFRYTNATREQEFGNAGGFMEFARAKNGSWVISGWSIRMPQLVQRETRMSGISGSRATTAEVKVEQIRVEGGEVALVTRNRGADTLWSRPPLPMAGVVSDSLSGARAAGATIHVRGTNLVATTDDAGYFRIADALPGQYTLDVRTKSLTSLGAVHTHYVTHTDSVTPVAIRVPSAAQIVQSVCPAKEAGSAAFRRDGLVAGTVVVAGDTTPARGVRVLAQWDEVTPTGRRWGSLETETDARGTFRLCGLPLDTRLAIGATLEGADARGGEPALRGSPGAATAGLKGVPGALAPLRGVRSYSTTVPAQVTLTVAARFASLDLAIDPAVVRGGTLAGVVLSDVNGQPMADVEIAIPSLGRSVVTADRGAFRFEDVTPGTHVVMARKVGYALIRDSIQFAPNTSVQRSIMMRRAQTLDTVAVVGRADLEFEENRKLGLGHFLTRADIDKLAGQPLSIAMRQMPAVGLITGRGTNAAWIMNSRDIKAVSIDPRQQKPNVWCPDPGTGLSLGLKCGCYAAVYFDGSLMNPPESRIVSGRVVGRANPPFDINSIPTASIEGVEWYTGSAQLPARYNSFNAECGVLVIHRRKTR